MSLTELSEAATLPPSTTHRLLTTLESERFVRADGQSGLWRVGVSAFIVGSCFARSRDTLALVRPYLRRLTDLTGETSNLFIESDGEAICIGQVESRHAMRAITGVGGRIKMHSSGAGKAMLAFSERVRLGDAGAGRGGLRGTEGNKVDDRIWLASLEKVRAQGFAIDDEEHAVGLRCVAAPIFNEFGEAVAAISVSGPSARIPHDRLTSLGKTVANAATEATRDFGGTDFAARSSN